MSVVAVVIVVTVAIFAASILGAWLRGGTSAPTGDASAVREDMQRLLTTQAQGFAAQMGQLTQLVSQQIGDMRKELEQGVASTGRITIDAQREMSEQLRSSTDVISRLHEHLGQAQVSGRELTEAAQTMQAVLGGSKKRGSLGEAALESVLADVLPRSAYELEHRFASGATADAVLRTGHKLIAIDASFPLDAYRQMDSQGEEAGAAFAQAVREHVDSVAGQFIAPAEGTLDMALMFVPSESAFHELLVTADGQGRLEDYCRQKNVLAVSPNSLHAYLSTILVGLKGMEFEENARRMIGELEGLQKEFEEFTELHLELGHQLHQARQTHEDVSHRLEHTRTVLARTAQGAAVPSNGASATAGEAEAAATVVPAAPFNNGS
jgi:DNA recombination protein RmuC